MSNTDRDPADQALTAQAVATWLSAEPGTTTADDALMAVLVEQGVLTPAEAEASYLEYGSHEHDCVHIALGDIWVAVYLDGTTDVL